MSAPISRRVSSHDRPPGDPSGGDPTEGALRRAGIAAALGLLIVGGLWATRPAASAQPPDAVVEEEFEEPEALGEDGDDGQAPADVPVGPIELGGVPADDRGPADLLPAEGAAAYFAFAGTDAAGPALADTAAHRSLIDSGLLPAVGRSFGAIWENGLEKAKEAAERAGGGGLFGGGEDFRIEIEAAEEEEGVVVEEFGEIKLDEERFEEEFDEERFEEEEEIDVQFEVDRPGDGDLSDEPPLELEEADALEEFGEEDEVVAEERPELVAALRAFGKAALEGGGAVSIHLPAEGPPLPAAFVVLPGAADAAEVLLSEMNAEERATLRLREVEVEGVTILAGNVPGAPPMYNFGLWRVGSHLVAAVGPGAVQSAVAVTAGRGEALGTRALAANTPEDALLAGWLDFATVVDRFGEFAVAEADWRESGQITVSDVLRPLGLDALGGVRGSISADGEALRTDGEWTLRGEARGLLVALDPAPMSLGDLPPLPAEVGAFGAGSADSARIYDGVVEALAGLSELTRPQSRERAFLEDPNATLNGLAGFDVRAALLEPLGHVTAYYGDPRDGGLFGLGSVAAVSVEDADTLREGLATLSARVLSELPPDAEGTVAVTTAERYGTDVTTISVGGLFRPSVAVTDDWIVFAPTPQAVAAFLLRADGKLPRWEPTGRWEAPFARVPAEFTLLSAGDPRPGAAALNNLVGTLLPPLNQFGEGPDDLFLPPSELVTGPLFPNVSWATNTGSGVRGVGYASLPGLGGGGGGSSTAVLAVPLIAGSTALLLPAVQAAREAARRSQAQNNLKQLGLAAHNYHSTYNTFPRGTVEGTDLPPEQRLSWVVALLPYLEQQAMTERLDPKQAWNAGPNDLVARTAIPDLLNPSLPDLETTGEGYAPTHYVGIAGVGEDAATSPTPTRKTGVFGYDRATALRDLRDGTSNTLMYGSVHENVGPWAQGGRATVRAFTQRPYIDGPDGFGGHAGGTNFLAADGSVHFISENIDPAVLEAMATASGGEIVDWDEVE